MRLAPYITGKHKANGDPQIQLFCDDRTDPVKHAKQIWKTNALNCHDTSDVYSNCKALRISLGRLETSPVNFSWYQHSRFPWDCAHQREHLKMHVPAHWPVACTTGFIETMHFLQDPYLNTLLDVPFRETWQGPFTSLTLGETHSSDMAGKGRIWGGSLSLLTVLTPAAPFTWVMRLKHFTKKNIYIIPKCHKEMQLKLHTSPKKSKK